MAYSNNKWSKVITILTTIFGIVYSLIVVILIAYYKDPNIISWDYLLYMALYIARNDPQSEILLYCIAIFNTCWIIISITLSVMLFQSDKQDFSIKRTQKILKVSIAWIVFGFLSMISDIVSMIIAGIFYAGDNPTQIEDGALYVLIITSRGVIFLIFHIASWIGMIFITSALQKSIVEDSTKPIGRTVPLKPPKPVLKPSKIPTLEETNVDRVRDWYSHYEGEKTNNNSKLSPSYIPRVEGVINPAFNNDNYVSRPTSPAVQPPGYHIPGSKTNVMVNGVPSGTLRRQLPWSYVPDGKNLPQHSRVSHSPVPPVTPRVPAPDYDQNQKIIQRRELNQPRWSQYM